MMLKIEQNDCYKPALGYEEYAFRDKNLHKNNTRVKQHNF